MGTQSKVGAIDIGSNGIRMLIGSVGDGTDIEHVCSARAAVRLGRDVFTGGHIRRARVRSSIKALTEFRRLADKHKVSHVRAVATSAVREARNGRTFVRGVAGAMGVPLQIITGREEARLVHLAVAHHLDLRGKTALCVDIGGGSVELGLSRNGIPSISRSFPLGTLRMVHQLKNGTLDNDQLDRLIAKFFRDARAKHRGPIDLVVGTGGNVECLAKLRMRFLGRKSDRKIRDNELRRLAKVLDRLSLKERVRVLGLRPDRADVIVPAIMVLRRVLHHSGLERIEVPHVGLRHGLLLDSA